MEDTKKPDKISKKKKEFNKIDDILIEVKSVFIIEWLTGIFRFYIKDRQLVPPTWSMRSCATIISITYAMCMIIYNDLPTGYHDLPDFKMVDFMDEIPPLVVLLQYVTTVLSTAFFLYKSNIDIIFSFADLDKQLLLHGTDYYVKSRNRNIRIIVATIVSHVLTIILDVMTDTENVTLGRVLAYPLYLIQKYEILVFCVTISMLNWRLRVINKYLAKFIEEKDKTNSSIFIVTEIKEVTKDVTNFIGSPTKNNIKIRELAIMYDSIGGICSSINSVFNFPIFMTLVSTFSYIVVTIWTSLFFYKDYVTNESGPLMTVTIWCVTNVLTVSTMCYVCENLKVVRNNTKVLVNQVIMDYDLPKGMRVQAKAFMELVEAWPLRIFIYDMFSVDITLILKFISVSTTYLIVIIQISHFL